MDRRLALKQLAFFTGGLFVVPSCDFGEGNILAAYEKLQITEAHKKLLSKVVETILPGGEITGAKELNIQDFILVMANDCLAAENQLRFTNGLKQFDLYVQKEHEGRLEKMPQKKAEEVYKAAVNIQQQDDENPRTEGSDDYDLTDSLETSKKFTLQGYLSSEYFMTEIMPYEMIPGGFQGEVLIEPNEKIILNG